MSQLASKITASCEWKILAKKGNTVALNVTRLVLKSGWVRIASGKKTLFTLLKPGPEPSYPWQYKSTGNVMTLELLSYPDARGNLDSNTYLSASYAQIEGTHFSNVEFDFLSRDFDETCDARRYKDLV